MQRRILVVAGAVIVVAVFAFGATSASSATSTLGLGLTGLEPLGGGHYEGWAIFGEEKVSTGKFALASDGSLWTLDGQPIESFEVDRDLNGADMIVVTIEPDGDVDAVPSGIAVIGDDLWNDIEGAQRAGLAAWLVRTGKFRADVLESSTITPDRVVDSVADVIQ